MGYLNQGKPHQVYLHVFLSLCKFCSLLDVSLYYSFYALVPAVPPPSRAVAFLGLPTPLDLSSPPSKPCLLG